MHISCIGADAPGKGELEPEVERALLHLVDDFVCSATAVGSAMATHRQSDTLGVQDLKPFVEGSLGLHVPGFGHRRRAVPAAPRQQHRARAQAVKRARNGYQRTAAAAKKSA